MSRVHTTLRGISSTPAINHYIDRHFSKLKRAHGKINTCKVVVGLAKNNTYKDKLYTVCIDITIPGKELVSKKQDSNLFIAIRNSFLALEQLLAKHHKQKLLSSKKLANYLLYSNNDTLSQAI